MSNDARRGLIEDDTPTYEEQVLGTGSHPIVQETVMPLQYQIINQTAGDESVGVRCVVTVTGPLDEVDSWRLETLVDWFTNKLLSSSREGRMTNEERRELLDFIREQASLIEGKLPPTAEIPDRNAYAHMFKLIKTTLGLSYKECCTNEIPTIKALVSGEATKWLAIDNSE